MLAAEEALIPQLTTRRGTDSHASCLVCPQKVQGLVKLVSSSVSVSCYHK